MLRILILLALFLPSYSVFASVPVIGGTNTFQREPFDTDKQINWCIEDVDNSHFEGSVVQMTDDNNYTYWSYMESSTTSNSVKWLTDHDTDCVYKNQYYQTPRPLLDDTQEEVRIQFIAGGDVRLNDVNYSGDSDVLWRDATGGPGTCTDYDDNYQIFSFGGEQYSVIDIKCTLNQDIAQSGQGGYLRGINDIDVGRECSWQNGRQCFDLYYFTYNISSSTADLRQINNSTELKDFMDSLYIYQQESNESLPSANTDYIVQTFPDNGQTVALDFTLYGYLNLVNPTSSTTSYYISFLSNSGLNYDSIEQCYTTESASTFQFSHTYNLEYEDIISTRLYLYDNDNCNATGLKYISPYYEFNVAYGGDTNSNVNLGIYKTSGLETCGSFALSTSTSIATGIGYAFCSVGYFLFYPNESSLNYFKTQASTTKEQFPFVYVFDTAEVIETAFTSTTTNFSISASTSIGSITFIDSATISSFQHTQTIKNLISMFLWFTLFLLLFRRVKNML